MLGVFTYLNKFISLISKRFSKPLLFRFTRNFYFAQSRGNGSKKFLTYVALWSKRKKIFYALLRSKKCIQNIEYF